jgi:hypothetical protein
LDEGPIDVDSYVMRTFPIYGTQEDSLRRSNGYGSSDARRSATIWLSLRRMGQWIAFVFRDAVKPFRCAVLLRASPGRPSVAARRTHAFDPWRLRANFPGFCVIRRSASPLARSSGPPSGRSPTLCVVVHAAPRKPGICRRGKSRSAHALSPVSHAPENKPRSTRGCAWQAMRARFSRRWRDQDLG